MTGLLAAGPVALGFPADLSPPPGDGDVRGSGRTWPFQSYYATVVIKAVLEARIKPGS